MNRIQTFSWRKTLLFFSIKFFFIPAKNVYSYYLFYHIHNLKPAAYLVSHPPNQTITCQQQDILTLQFAIHYATSSTATEFITLHTLNECLPFLQIVGAIFPQLARLMCEGILVDQFCDKAASKTSGYPERKLIDHESLTPNVKELVSHPSWN